MSFSFYATGTKKGVAKKVREDGQIGENATQGHKAVGDFILATLDNAHEKVSFVKVTANGSHSRWDQGGIERTSGNVTLNMEWGTFDPDPVEPEDTTPAAKSENESDEEEADDDHDN